MRGSTTNPSRATTHPTRSFMTAPRRGKATPKESKSHRSTTIIICLVVVVNLVALFNQQKVDSFKNDKTGSSNVVTRSSSITTTTSTTLDEEHISDPREDPSCCKIQCTRPPNTCCLPCRDAASDMDRELLMALMEGLTAHIGVVHNKSQHAWLKDRSWSGNSHIGNRDQQAPFYFEWAASRSNNSSLICEIGFNGGHSAAIFLAATSRTTKVTAFDLQAFDYSVTGLEYVQKLYPGRLQMIQGSSTDTVPKFSQQHGRACDVFSVDGDHSLGGARIDFQNAIAATKVGGWIIADDMNAKPWKALNGILTSSPDTLGDLHCLDQDQLVSYKDRYDTTTMRRLENGWCWVQVLK